MQGMWHTGQSGEILTGIFVGKHEKHLEDEGLDVRIILMSN
jgi:hypothetical protein